MRSLRRKRRPGTSVLLPWESRQAGLSDLASGRRWRAILAPLAIVLALVGTWRFADHQSRVRVTRAGIAEVQRAVALFRAEVGRCPHSTVELVHPPRAAAQYLTEVPIDGWGRPLYVRCPGLRPADPAEVISGGPAGRFSIKDIVM